MWLYLPSPASNSAPASACSAKVPALDSNYSVLTCAPFATWSGKPLQPRNLSRLWKREPLMRRLSGLTSPPSTLQRGVDAWTCSLRASRARTSASPAAVLGLTATAPGSSSPSWILRTIATRRDSFWRTSAPSLLPPPPLWTKPKATSSSAQPPESWESWPTAGGTRNGSLFPRPMWAPRMDEHDGSASRGAEWMTPNVPNGGRCLPKELVDAKGKTPTGQKRTVGLESQSRHWATPDCNSSSYSNGKFGMNLREQEATWPTPASRDFRTPNSMSLQERGGETKGEQLPNFVEHHFSHPVLSTLDGRPLSPTARTLPRRLNPAFACWLMGWPIWWTNPALTSCARSAMASYRCRLQWHLLSLCGEHGLSE